VPDEGYSERHLMKVILSVPDEGYSERTWWRLLQTCVVRTKFDIYFLFFFTLVKIQREVMKEIMIVITRNGTYLWSAVTHIFRNG
jgi:hypothetical protein